MGTSTRPIYTCSFCGKRQEQVHRLLSGPGGVYICDECVQLAQEILDEEEQDEEDEEDEDDLS